MITEVARANPPEIFESLSVTFDLSATIAWTLIDAQFVATFESTREEVWMAQAGSGRLTTHVLDTATGKPAAGLSISLYRFDGDKRVLLKTVATNDDGRCDAPLLEGETFAAGEYELVFSAGDYLRGQGTALPSPAFLDIVPIRFGIAEHSHYHVPLLISPYGYSTYRGS
jgi:5-hydroxyisourate hydrolase